MAGIIIKWAIKHYIKRHLKDYMDNFDDFEKKQDNEPDIRITTKDDKSTNAQQADFEELD